MSDFQYIQLQLNTGSDLVPVFSTDAFPPGGTGGANEIRFCNTGAGGLVTAGSWPIYPKPASVQLVPEAWGILTDTGSNASVTGNKWATYYNGTTLYAQAARFGWSQDGTFASAPKITCFADTTMTAPSPGTQPPGANNDTVTNGQSTDTSSTSYLKINAYGYGVDTSGNQQTPVVSGSPVLPVAPSATDGYAGAKSPATNAWIPSNWQSAQGLVQYIQDGVTPAWTTHIGTPVITYYWYINFALFTGPNMSVGAALTWDIFFLYTFS